MPRTTHLTHSKPQSGRFHDYNEAESVLLNDVIRAMEMASEKGITDHQMSMIISHAASMVGVELLMPTFDNNELSSDDVIAYLENMVDCIHETSERM
ncbi:hypothetical protein KIH87_07400 [Paraneptunicella aestuarii]|uniref:hypothetical protein n=1 Tax=Paraneptunicella aestuarii TaxID=2831148 RepID=UPI001E63C9B5|nr:hypothetical protein [Paraneptunicella aestuarii]UAA40162.1 hypothetical protein KIH87_07400 [Paraneptunicella aestuarii]